MLNACLACLGAACLAVRCGTDAQKLAGSDRNKYLERETESATREIHSATDMGSARTRERERSERGECISGGRVSKPAAA